MGRKMMKMKRTLLFLIVICLAVAGSFMVAGDLEPPGSPDSTMVTLQEIYDRVSASPVGIAKTNLTVCYDGVGTVIACAGTGQDGEYQTGVSVDPRFTDNLDGTVTDNMTGLIWLSAADCFEATAWTNALSDANSLADGACGLNDHSQPGDWRLPNVNELQSLIDYSEFDPAIPAGHPFSAVPSDYYWSSTTVLDIPGNAWFLNVTWGGIRNADKDFAYRVWPVRGGH